MTGPLRILQLEPLGGHPALDFINTLDWRGRADAAEECLVSYQALLVWASRGGLLEPREAKALDGAAAAEPEAAAEALAETVALREALHRLVAAATAGGQPATADLERLNHWLAATPATARLVARPGGGYAWAEPRAGLGLSAPIIRIAHQAAELLASDRLGRVRCCAGPGCGWLFVDASPNRGRRWCSMEGCGNRAKAKRHYRRATGRA